MRPRKLRTEARGTSPEGELSVLGIVTDLCISSKLKLLFFLVRLAGASSTCDLLAPVNLYHLLQGTLPGAHLLECFSFFVHEAVG